MKKNYLFLGLFCFVLSYVSSIQAQTYCSPSFKNPSQHYISRVQLNTINNISTFPATGSYNNFTSISTSLTMGQSYPLTISTFRSNASTTAGYGIWIDYNNDGDFNDANETISSFGPSSVSPQTITVNIPTSVSSGSKRLRINMVTSYKPGSCANDTGNFGETEDYTVLITQPLNPIAVNDVLTVTRNSIAGALNQINVGTNDLIGTASVSDGEDYSLATAIVTTANNGTVTEVSDGVFQYIPANNFMGIDTFTYTLCNAANTCVSATVTVNVTLGACTPVSNSSATSYITKFKLYDASTVYFDNTSGDNSGFGNFLNLPPGNLFLGNSYSVDLDTNGSNLGWSLYVDLNQDGDFVDAGERLYDTGGEETTPFVIRTITIPSSALSGKTILRVGTRRYWSSNVPCGQTSQPEEFEDYLIHLNLNPTSVADIGVLGNGNTIITGTTNANFFTGTNFGIVDVNSGLKTRVFTITNYGSQNLTLGTVPVSFQSGSNAAFSIVSQPSPNLVLTTGQTTSFAIAFNPSATSLFTANVVVNSNDLDENPFVFSIQGEGAQIYQDVDGDTVNANIDTDDDNDGISDVQEQLSCLASSNSSKAEVIFLNENFGAGTSRARINGVYPGVTTTYCFEDGSSAMADDECDTIVHLDDGKYTVHYSIANGDGINQISSTGTDLSHWADQYWYNGQDHTPGDVNGRMAIFNATYDPGVFYETEILGTIPSVPINYSFWVLNIDKANSVFGAGVTRILPNISVKFWSTDRTILYGTYNTGNILRCNSDPTGNCTQSEWRSYETTISIPSSSFIIQFVNNAPGGLGNDLALDDIKIAQLLCDLDSDGVADVLDIDNDNDGIPNVYETLMIANPDPDRDGTTFGTTWVDANNNGLSDIYEGLTVADSDSDGVPNYLDLDSDNDTIFDSVEADWKGDVDVNGDGTGDGNDMAVDSPTASTDGDGYLSILDANDTDLDKNDFGTYAYQPPTDSDLDGIPDYIDVWNNLKNQFDIKETIYAQLDSNDDGIIDGSLDSDKDGILDWFDTNDASFGSPRDLNQKYSLSFDGRNDYIEETTAVLSGLSNATIMTFLKLDAGFSSKGTIIAEDNFKISIDDSRFIEVYYNGVNHVFNSAIPWNIWTQITTVLDFSGQQQIKVFINGDLVGSFAATTPIMAGTNLLRMGCTTVASGTDFFKGEMEEIRIFDTALSEDQFRKIIYQEIKASDFTKGEVVPLNISGLLSSALVRYYRMDVYKDDILDNLVTPTLDMVTGAKLYNFKILNFQTAPLPFVTNNDGNWSSSNVWQNGNVSNIPNQPWSIVQIKNNITTNDSMETLGLFVENSKTLFIDNNKAITNHWYLKLDGKIDLIGKSQLVQTENSVLDTASQGFIEREQDGVANKYNYNYWSSPVSTINSVTNNNGFVLASQMKDATNPNTIQPITFVNSLDGMPTSPISISNKWLYKYQNSNNSYANWTSFSPTDLLPPGTGFTMKGVTSLFSGERQNYAFVGKPNNADVLLPITANNINLCGNPYPSAIDSQEFILDNIVGGNLGTTSSISGALYFWEHAKENNTHVLQQYKGGYAVLNLVGGIPPMATSMISGLGSSAKIPNRFIPVGQGFFVRANNSGGNIIFKNKQRGFKLESDNSVNGSNVLFRNNASETLQNNYKKIRLKFTSVDNFERQILLGFMDNLATDNLDAGYDAVLFEDNPSDFYFSNSGEKLVIQGVSSFLNENVYPVVVKTNLSGIVRIQLERLENFPPDTKAFVLDSYDHSYHEISNQNTFAIHLSPGEYVNRFSLRFVNNTLSNDSVTFLQSTVTIFYAKAAREVVVKSNSWNMSQAQIFDLQGKKLLDTKFSNAKEMQLPVANFATGTYVVKIYTETGTISKKIVIF